MQRFDELDSVNLKSDIPAFRAGDNIKVHVKVIEGSRSRVQVFQGVVIRIHGSGVGRTFTRPGVFRYDCTIHPGMAGRVEVR